MPPIQELLMNTTILVSAVALLLAAMPVHAEDKAALPAATETGFTAAQKTEIDGMIRQFLVEKEPETVMKAVEVLKQREQSAQQKNTQQSVELNKKRIYDDVNSPILGNPKGDVTIVEFYDYSCGYCKVAQGAVKDLLEKDKNVRFIAKEFPILGEGSVIASRAALASVKQKKFEKFHDALMAFRGQFTEAVIMDTAKTVGLDTAQLKKDMGDKAIDDMIAENRKLGNDLGVRGTPMFIIGDQVTPGALDAEGLKQAIANARNPVKK
jgi:protein-disulfide isomerase